MDPLKPTDHSQQPAGPKKKTVTVERPRDQEGESTQSKPLIDEAIFPLINSAKQSFPILPQGAQRRPGLVTYQNQATGATAFIIEDVHGSRITHEILTDVFGQVKGVKPEETLFVLEGVKPNEVATFNRSNAFHPNQICCAVANESGANVINPIANQSQMSLVNAYITEAGKQGLSRTEALGGIVGSLVFSSPPAIQFDIPHAIDELSKAWGGKVGTEEMYNAVEKSLDLQRPKVEEIMGAFQGGQLDSWETVEAAINSKVASREEIIGSAAIMYANQNFRPGQYPDCRAVFQRARKMWGDSAPKFDELHEAFITATTGNPRQRNMKLGQILLEVQDRLTQENFEAELKARPQIKNIITIAGYLHTGGIRPILESHGYKESK